MTTYHPPSSGDHPLLKKPSKSDVSDKKMISNTANSSKGGEAYKKKMELLYLEKATHYELEPSTCASCGAILEYSKRINKFCSHSCRASKINSTRKLTTGSTKLFKCVDCQEEVTSSNRLTPAKARCGTCKVMRKTIKSKPKSKPKDKPLKLNSPTIEVVPPPTNRTCQHCFVSFESKSRRKYCPEHIDKYSKTARNGFKFAFNMDKYPDLFDLAEIRKVGFYRPHANLRGSGPVNKNGYVRDHRVSVNEAIRNGYDPYYITHPINCEMMLASENSKKQAKSSISYAELQQLVEQYESNKLV